MTGRLRRLGPIACVLALASLVPRAQMRVVPLDDEQGHVALGLALRHVANTGILMHATAHPDDENNGLLVMLNRGQGYRTVLATATRGNGGQNEIGPEIFDALGILRTQELAAVHRFDGAEQYFTRAVDFGYSFSADETFEKWGKDEITADYVRLMRMVRPDVVIALSPTGTGGGQHHQASAIVAREAVKLAGDPAKYPEQIKEGLRPWQPKKFYYSAGFGPASERETQAKTGRINLALYDPLLGKTYEEIGSEARSMHKCQGMAQLLSLPGPATTGYQLAETTIPGQMQKDETSLFDGVDSSITGLAKFAGAHPPKDLTEGLSVISTAVQTAQKKFDSDNDEAALKPLLDGLFAVRVLRRELRNMSIDDVARYEVDFRLRQKEGELQRAALLANGVRVEALADDGVVVPGQSTKVAVIVVNHGSGDINVKQVKFDGFEGDASCTLTPVTAGDGRGGRSQAPAAAGQPMSILKKDQAARCEPTLKIPPNARITEPYWHRRGEAGRYTFDADAPFGLPFRPTPFYVQVTMALGGGAGSEDVIDGLAVQYRYEGDIFSGEKRTELLVVPPFSVRMSPEIAIIPETLVRATAAAAQPSGRGRGAARAPASAGADTAATREVRVTVVNDTPSAAESVVKLEVPEGWTAMPPEQSVKLARQDLAQTVRFQVKPATNSAPGEFHVRAVATADGQSANRGFQVIEYPHIRRYHIYDDADTTLKVIDVKTAPNLKVGYVMGVGDQVPPAIEQLGAKVEMIGAEDLAWGDLSRFDVIVTGVRAYERREDLRSSNSRLLEYVFNGGTLIVQYNKFEFNDAQYGPYPARVGAFGGSGLRVTDEAAPVQILAPNDPALAMPNKITDAAWRGWVQERGLYFLGEKDSRYRDLVQLSDSFPNNPGVKTGALVEAQYGKGRWVYVGLGLWRQLPAGTDGAYQLLANLISLARSPASRPTTTASAAQLR